MSEPTFDLSVSEYESLLADESIDGWKRIMCVGTSAMYVQKNHQRWYVDYYFEELHHQHVGDFTPAPFFVSSVDFTERYLAAASRGKRKHLYWFKHSEAGRTWKFEMDSRSPNVKVQCVG